MELYKRILTQTSQQLQGLGDQAQLSLEEILKAFSIAENGLEKLQRRTQQVGFTSPANECYFFKHVKPLAESYYIYYKERLEMLSKMPRAFKKQLKFYQHYLSKFENYLQENFEFYLYYKRDLQIFDEQYFLRGKKEIQLYKGTTYYTRSSSFSTNRDGCLAIILAYERLIDFSKLQLEPEPGKPTHLPNEKHLTWTAKKVDLVELIYALHTGEVFNHGQADLKQIVRQLEQSFCINLGEVYRSFLEIRARKIENTKFLNFLKKVLSQRMYEADEWGGGSCSVYNLQFTVYNIQFTVFSQQLAKS